MGQQSMIIVVLSSLLLSISVFGIMSGWNFSNETTAELFEREQALNITRSGVNMAVSKLRKQKTWRTGFDEVRVAGGSVSVGVQSLGLDTVRIISVGTINGFSHQAEVVAKLSSIFPNVESALTVFGDSVEFHNDGKSFLIDGRDYMPNATGFGPYPPVSGMGVQSEKIVKDLKSHLDPKIENNFQGAGGVPSIGSFSPSDLAALHKFYADRATTTLPPGAYAYNGVFGTLDDPEIVYVPGDLEWNGTIKGSGILVVDGKLQLSGNIAWDGIILTLSGDVTIELGGTGNPHILGTVWVGNTDPSNITDVTITGNPSIKYSYLTLMTVLGNLGLLDVEILSYYE
ncbi:MAG: hypothetical protein C0600_15660 [Ignavibacteria bacterium]|nr:MAG: hypothetical protein C0600_15660 [Ignavibacteria bacterium]